MGRHLRCSLQPDTGDHGHTVGEILRPIWQEASHSEMPSIDTRIVEHEIKMYLDVKPVRQQLRPIHPKKAVTIKAEVEKLLHAGFIYPVPLTD